MKNLNISKVLKHYRKQNELSVSDVAFILESKDLSVAPKTIYGWESGQTQPDADTLLLLCEIYGIKNILETFGYPPPEEESILPTKFEETLIKRYRENPQMHIAIHKLLDLN